LRCADKRYQDRIGIAGFRPRRYPKFPFDINYLLRKRKIIFLNKDTLDKLLGYKAEVQLDKENGQLILVITGLKKSAKKIYDSIKELPKDEIYGK